MKTAYVSLAIVASFLAVSENVMAADIYCSGLVNNVLVYADGTVAINAQWRADYTTICNLSVERNGVTTTTCTGWLALAEGARKRGEALNIWYPNATFAGCSSILLIKRARHRDSLMSYGVSRSASVEMKSHFLFNKGVIHEY
jgi:hypothetical protein